MITNPKPSSARKRVQFNEGGFANNNNHFTKPAYIDQVSPTNNMNNNQSKGMGGRSHSLPQFESAESKNAIPTRVPSGGFKPSFVPSEPPMSARDHRQIPANQPVSYPSGYSDHNQLGASAAKISEMMRQTPRDNLKQWTSGNDCKL